MWEPAPLKHPRVYKTAGREDWVFTVRNEKWLRRRLWPLLWFDRYILNRVCVAFTLCLTHIYNYYMLVKSKMVLRAWRCPQESQVWVSIVLWEPKAILGQYQSKKHSLLPSIFPFREGSQGRQLAAWLIPLGEWRRSHLWMRSKTLTGLSAVILWLNVGLSLHLRVITGCFVKEKWLEFYILKQDCRFLPMRRFI